MKPYTFVDHNLKYIGGDYLYEDSFYDKPSIINIFSKKKIDASVLNEILLNGDKKIKTFSSLSKREFCDELIDITTVNYLKPRHYCIVTQYDNIQCQDKNGSMIRTFCRDVFGNICVFFMSGPYFYLLYEDSEHVNVNTPYLIPDDDVESECDTAGLTIEYTCHMKINKYEIIESKLFNVYESTFDLNIVSQRGGNFDNYEHMTKCYMFICDNKLIIDIDNRGRKYSKVSQSDVLIFDLETKSSQLIENVTMNFKKGDASDFQPPSEFIHSNRFVLMLNLTDNMQCIIDLKDKCQKYGNILQSPNLVTNDEYRKYDRSIIEEIGPNILILEYRGKSKLTHVFKLEQSKISNDVVDTNSSKVIDTTITPSQPKILNVVVDTKHDTNSSKVIDKTIIPSQSKILNVVSDTKHNINSSKVIDKKVITWSFQQITNIAFDAEIVDNTIIISASVGKSNIRYEHVLVFERSLFIDSIDTLLNIIKIAVEKTSENIEVKYKIYDDVINMYFMIFIDEKLPNLDLLIDLNRKTNTN
jgi:hypothetical protein